MTLTSSRTQTSDPHQLLKSLLSQLPAVTAKSPLFSLEEVKAPQGRIAEHWSLLAQVPKSTHLTLPTSPEEHQQLKLWLQETANTLDSTIDKGVKIESLLDAAPSPICLETLTNQYAAAIPTIESQHAPNGCNTRSHRICEFLDQTLSTDTHFKIALRSNHPLALPVARDYQGLSWSYHITTAALAEDGKVYALDPLFNEDKPTELGQWMKSFTPKNQSTLFTLRIAPSNTIVFTKDTEKSRVEEIHRRDENQLIALTDKYNAVFKPPYHCTTQEPIPPTWAFQLDETSPERFSFGSMTYILSSHHCEVDFNNLTYRVDNNSWSPIFVKDTIDGSSLKPKEVLDFLRQQDLQRIELTKLPCLLSTDWNTEKHADFKVIQ